MKCCFRLPRGQFVLAWAATMPLWIFCRAPQVCAARHWRSVADGCGGTGQAGCLLWQHKHTQLRVKLSQNVANDISFWDVCCRKKKNHHFSFLLWDWKHWWSLHFSFSFIFHEAKEVMEEMEKRGYCWDYEKFGFTKCNCLNCSLANCMDKI